MSRLAIAVCIPSTGSWTSGTGYSLFRLAGKFHSGRMSPKYDAQALTICKSEGSLLSQMRQEMVKAALQWGATHLFFVDSDMMFPPEILEELLARDLPIVAANCTTRVEPIQAVAVGWDGKRVESKGKTGIEEVQHVGLAVALVEAAVFKEISPPHFLMDWIPSQKRYCGEDVYFCARAHEAGFKVHIDHDVSQKILHIGSRPYGHADLILPSTDSKLEKTAG